MLSNGGGSGEGVVGKLEQSLQALGRAPYSWKQDPPVASEEISLYNPSLPRGKITFPLPLSSSPTLG